LIKNEPKEYERMW